MAILSDRQSSLTGRLLPATYWEFKISPCQQLRSQRAHSTSASRSSSEPRDVAMDASGVLARLVGAGDALDGSGEGAAAVITAAALTEEDLSKLRAAEAKDWHAAASSAEALGRLRSCLVAHIFHGAPQLRALGACAYLAALGNSAAPTAALLDDVALHGVLRVCREAARALDRASGPEDPGLAHEKDESVDADMEAGPVVEANWPAILAAVVQGMAPALARVSLKGSEDLVRATSETLLASAAASADVAAAAFAALREVADARHGDLRDTLRVVFHQLSGAVLAFASRGGKGAAASVLRAAAVDFACAVVEEEPRAGPAAAALVRHVCLKCPDRADVRQSTVGAVCRLTRTLPWSEQQRVVLFLAKMSRTKSAAHRVMAVDLAQEFLVDFEGVFAVPEERPSEEPAEAPRTPAPGPTPGPASAPRASLTPGASAKSPASSLRLALATPCSVGTDGLLRTPCAAPLPHSVPLGVLCLAVLLQRCSDRQASVRARALSQLAGVLEGLREGGERDLAAEALWRLGSLQAGGGAPLPSAVRTRDSFMTDLPTHLTAATAQTGGATGGAPGASGTAAPLHTIARLKRLAQRRGGDDRGAVRKASVALMRSLLLLARFVAEAGDPEDASPTAEDLALLTRGAADVLLTVRRAALAALVDLAAAFPGTALATEAAVAAACRLVHDPESAVQGAALDAMDALVLAGRGATAGLRALARLGARGTAAAARGVSLLRQARRLRGRALWSAMAKAAAAAGEDGEARLGAWTVLGVLAGAEPEAADWREVRAAWERGRGGAVMGDGWAGERVQGQVLGAMAAVAPRFPGTEAADVAATLLEDLLSLQLPCSLATAHVLALERFCCSAAGDLDTRAGKEAHAAAMRAWVEQVYAAAEGEVRTFVDVLQAGAEVAEGDAQATAAIYAVGEVALLGAAPVPGQLSVLVQGLAGRSLIGAGGGAPVAVPDRVQAFAWACVGKMAVADEALAKRAVPLIVQELAKPVAPAVRNNILVVLCDLCTKYTALVDAHIPKLVACMRDGSDVVRKQSLALMARLLLSDFVKCRGAMFHQLVLALVDRAGEVRGIAEYLVRDTLSQRMPLLAYNHFLEALFVANDCPGLMEEHDVGLSQGARAPSQAFEGLAGSSGVAGEAGAALRRRIYATLLQCMAPESRFQTMAKVVQQVVQRFAEGDLPLEAPATDVLADALHVLGSPDLYVGAAGGLGDAVEDAETVAQAAGHVKARLVEGMMRRHLQEAVVPVLSALKSRLEAARHPASADVTACVASLVRNSKANPAEVISDTQLLAEVQFCLKKKAGNQTKKVPAGRAAEGRAEKGAARGQEEPRTPAPTKRRAERRVPAGTSPDTPLASQVLREAAEGTVRSPGSSDGTPFTMPKSRKLRRRR